MNRTTQHPTPTYSTVVEILAWGTLYGPEEDRAGAAEALARHIIGDENPLGRADGPER